MAEGGVDSTAAGAPRQWNRWVYFFAAVIQVMSCSGALFGWVNMAVILTGERALAAGGCNPVADATCAAAQQVALNGVYTTASVISFSTPVLSGMFLDYYGPRATVRLLITIFAAGVACLLAWAAAASASAVAAGADAAAADAASAPLLYVAFICIGTAGSANLIPLFSVSLLFPGHESMALSILNGSFDGGSLVFKIMAAMYAAGVPLKSIMAGYLGGPVLLVILFSLFLWPAQPFSSPVPAAAPVTPVAAADSAAAKEQALQQQHPDSSMHGGAAHVPKAEELRVAVAAAVEQIRLEEAAVADDDSHKDKVQRRPLVVVDTAHGDSGTYSPRTAAASSRSPRLASSSFSSSDPPLGVGLRKASSLQHIDSPALIAVAAAAAGNNSVPDLSLAHGTASPPKLAHPQLPPVADAGPGPASAASAEEAAEAQPPHPFLPGIDLQRLHSLPFRQQLRSPEFTLFCAFFTCGVVRFNYYIGTVHSQLEALGQVNAAYTNIFGIVLPAGCVSVFIAGTILDRAGNVAGVAALWALSVVLSILNLIPSLQVQVATMVCFALFRGFLFSNMAAYCANVFGYRTLGRLVGVLTMVGGIFGLLQSPLLTWAYAAGTTDTTSSGGTATTANFAVPNGFMLAVMVVNGAFPVWLWRRARGARPATPATTPSPVSVA